MEFSIAFCFHESFAHKDFTKNNTRAGIDLVSNVHHSGKSGNVAQVDGSVFFRKNASGLTADHKNYYRVVKHNGNTDNPRVW